MTAAAPPGSVLPRLLAHRGLGERELTALTSFPAAEVRAVLAGGVPAGAFLRRLASALGAEPVDLFLLAGQAVPEDLAPLDAEAGRCVSRMVLDGVHLPAEGRRELLCHLRELPQEERRSVFAPDRRAGRAGAADEPLGPGGRIMRMFHFRNLDRSGLAHLMAVVTPTYLSAATYGAIGGGDKELTPRLVTDLATLLGFDAAELAAVSDVSLPAPPPPPAPRAVDAAALLLAARRLSAAQADRAADLAHSLRTEPRNVYRIDLPGRSET
ncbi:hypothetical protein ACFYVL_39210 [Streptomyces sp. NPDC004111]|uniref:hypothetical protein n=1 Tax=Streptomyces sp. NPDC004111 TaxID=3364690 RepID=UPI003679BE4A